MNKGKYNNSEPFANGKALHASSDYCPVFNIACLGHYSLCTTKYIFVSGYAVQWNCNYG